MLSARSVARLRSMHVSVYVKGNPGDGGLCNADVIEVADEEANASIHDGFIADDDFAIVISGLVKVDPNAETGNGAAGLTSNSIVSTTISGVCLYCILSWFGGQ